MHKKCIDLSSQFFIKLGMSIHCSTEVEDAFNAAGMEDVIREERNSKGNTKLDSKAQQWSKISLDQIMVPSLLGSGVAETEEIAKTMAESMLKELDNEYANGTVPNCALRLMLGRKSR
jgi:hypothetical protein